MKETINLQQIIFFFEENKEKFYRVAYSYVKNSDTALDLVHDAIVKAIQKSNTVKNHEFFKTWFYRILINECLSFIRKNKRLLFYNDITEYTKETDDLLKETEYIDLYDAIDKLPTKLKTIIILRFFEDMKLEEIAKITNTNLSTTKSRLYKALSILKIDMVGEENDR